MKRASAWLRENRTAGWCLLALLAVCAALVVRAPYGYDWSDESYYSALTYRLYLGDRPLVDVWEVHQFSCILSLPFLRLFLLLSGGITDGVVLYYRYVFIALELAASLYVFFALRRKSGDIPACIASIMLLSQAHFALNAYSYNTMLLLFSVLSATLCIDAATCQGGARTRRLLAGGVFYAFAVQAYPYFVASAPVYAFYWAYRVKTKRAKLRDALCFLCGVVAIGTAFIGYLVAKSTLAGVIDGIPKLLTDPDHQPVSLLMVVLQYFNTIRVVYSPVSWGAAFFLLFGVWYTLEKNEARRARMRYVGAIWAISLILAAAARTLTYDWTAYLRHNMAAMSIALTAPGLYLLNDRKKTPALLLFFLGCVASLCVQIGSNTRYLASSMQLLPASIAATLYLFDTLGDIFQRDSARGERAKLAKPLYIATAVVCMCAALTITTLRVTAVYRDAPIDQLDTTIATGPAKGLKTGSEDAARYEAIIHELRENAPAEGSMLVCDLLPDGYLAVPLQPATPSVFRISLDSDWLTYYYACLPERKASYVYALGETALDRVDGVSTSEADSFVAHDGYEKRVLPNGTVFFLRDG